jgi:cell division protein ZapE
LTPSELYHKKLAANEIHPDALQLDIVTQFDGLYARLVKSNNSLFSKIFQSKTPVKGMYLWGGVGIGKTFLMDCFYETLPFEKKWRIHFHKFMEYVHEQLTEHQSKKNPLEIVAKAIADKAQVLCFDEFFVKDVADAMVLRNLLTYMFEKNICLVTTSNIAPSNLYKNGLQRQNFLSAIALIEKNTQVIELNSNQDYRTLHIKNAGVYYSPLGDEANNNMQIAFNGYAKKPLSTKDIAVLGRNIPIICSSAEVAWFDFKNICGVPRSQRDYLELSKSYKVILVSNVFVMLEGQTDYITCFINMIDIFYDAGTKLILSAEKPAHELYTLGKMAFEFDRTESRLQEMQSEDYLFD